MQTDRFKKLRNHLVESRKFEDIFAFFLEDFAADPGFATRGQVVRSPLIEESLRRIGRDLFDSREVRHLHLHEIQEECFIHGVVVLGRRPGIVIYFTDVGVGLSVFPPTRASEEVHYSRFTIVCQVLGADPADN